MIITFPLLVQGKACDAQFKGYLGFIYLLVIIPGSGKALDWEAVQAWIIKRNCTPRLVLDHYTIALCWHRTSIVISPGNDELKR